MTSVPTYPNVLLSIEPDQAEAILDGSKRYEYRRVAPVRDPPIRFVLYATAPIQAAIGVFWSFSFVQTEPLALVDETIDRTPNEPDDVLEYLDGLDEATAIEVSTYSRFWDRYPRSRLEHYGFEPAQNFRYLPDVETPEPGEDSQVIA
jgi:predicted transcriptional regulator